jgi:hypothetical protein
VDGAGSGERPDAWIAATASPPPAAEPAYTSAERIAPGVTYRTFARGNGAVRRALS